MLPQTEQLTAAIAESLRVFPDFPSPGIRFQDLTPVFGQPALVRQIARAFWEAYEGEFERVLAVEARGFVLGAAVSEATDRPLVLARKKGKLPGPVHRVEYMLEYGTAVLEVQRDAISPGDRVLLIDDVLATGGTLAAAAELVTRSAGYVAGAAVVLTIDGLRGADNLAPIPVYSLLTPG